MPGGRELQRGIGALGATARRCGGDYACNNLSLVGAWTVRCGEGNWVCKGITPGGGYGSCRARPAIDGESCGIGFNANTEFSTGHRASEGTIK